MCKCLCKQIVFGFELLFVIIGRILCLLRVLVSVAQKLKAEVSTIECVRFKCVGSEVFARLCAPRAPFNLLYRIWVQCKIMLAKHKPLYEYADEGTLQLFS